MQFMFSVAFFKRRCNAQASTNKSTISQESGDLEKQKLRQTLKAREWDELMSSKKKMKVLEPVLRGCVWEEEGSGLEGFQLYAVCLVEPLPTADSSPSPEELSQKGHKEEHCKSISYDSLIIREKNVFSF